MPVVLHTRQLPYTPDKPYQCQQAFSCREDAIRAVRLLALFTGRKDLWRVYFQHLKGDDEVKLRQVESRIRTITLEQLETWAQDWEQA